MDDETNRVVDLAGSGSDRGEAHGEELRVAIAEALERWRATLAAATGRQPLDYVTEFLATTSHAATIERWSPDLGAEIRGIGRGSGQSLDEILAYNLMDEEWRYRAATQDACSVFGTVATAGGDPLLGQNMDLPVAMEGSQVVLRIAGLSGDPDQLVLTGAGHIGLLGVNRSGVACCVNTLRQLPWSPAGLPVAVIVRELLRRLDAESAADFLCSIPHAVGQHYAIGDPGGVLGFECSSDGVVAGPGAVRLVHTNHPLWTSESPRMNGRTDDEPVRHGSRARFAALDRAGDRIARSGDLERLLSVDADLCVRADGSTGSATFCSAVFGLAERPTIRVALGRPDVTPWRSVAWPDERPGTFDVVDPATGAAVATVADAGAVEAQAALEAAVAEQPSWSATAPRHRAGILRAVASALRDDRDALAATITSEMGKPVGQSLDEVAYAAGFFDWFADEAVRISGTHAAAPDGRGSILTVREPVGPCLLVTPWNFPLAMGARKIAPALAAGCTVILKPAPQTPLSSIALARILERAGLPDGVLSVLPTTRAAEVVAPLLADGRIRKLSFTGSTATGRLLLAQAADRVLRTSMELGGNAPFLVFPDADLERAVDAAVIAKLRNGGEACTAANRFLVHHSVVEEFTTRLTARFAAMTVGPGSDPASEVGPLIDAAAIAKVDRLVRDAVDRGAVVRTGGAPIDGPGFFYPPTVLADVPADAELLRTEVFGPVAAVRAFDDEDEAIREANDTEAGLVAYVMTRDLDRAFRVSAALRTGMVGINTGVVSDVAAPFGGVKESGHGREGGHLGIDEYLEHKYLALPTPRSAE